MNTSEAGRNDGTMERGGDFDSSWASRTRELLNMSLTPHGAGKGRGYGVLRGGKALGESPSPSGWIGGGGGGGGERRTSMDANGRTTTSTKKKKKKSKSKKGSSSKKWATRGDATKRDEETLKLANIYVADGNVVALRKLAAIRGLVSHGLRKRVWPILMDTKTTDVHGGGDGYHEKHGMSHKDDAVVTADIERSLWKFTTGWKEEDRRKERDLLRRIIDATVEGNVRGVHYYQGMHDIASVLLFVCGEGIAHSILDRLSHCHLRDCTRITIQPVLAVLRFLYPILEHADKEVHDYLASLDEPSIQTPYFAMSWYMTWFSHDIDDLDSCARLFDLFLASHPLMPLYVAAVAIQQIREEILSHSKQEGDMVYSLLKNLQILGQSCLTVDELIEKAVNLYGDAPPSSLIRGRLKREVTGECSTPFAYLEEQRWKVPDAGQHISSHAVNFSLKASIGRKAQTMLLGAIVTGLAGVAILSQQMQSNYSFK